MNDAQQLIQILTTVAIFLVVIIFVLVIAYFIIRAKNKAKEKQRDNIIGNVNTNSKDSSKKGENLQKTKSYNINSIFDFMDFEKVEDNMIIQKNGKYLMAVECQGVNYDLMSDMERTSVEQGFIEFLNTLKYEIQIYIQTRTVNLEQSIQTYKLKFRDIEEKYNILEEKYDQMKESNKYSETDLQKAYMELVRQKNKYEYTKDIIADTERSNLNSNVLHKKYYIIISYYEDEVNTQNYSKSEIQSMVFSELYTRARSITRTLSRCEVNTKILDSDGLIELLYMAYNRDDADLFSEKKAMSYGFEELYSTAPDVLDKKMQLLDKQIEEKAVEIANQAINEARSDKELMLKVRQENAENLVYDFAENLLTENETYLGTDIAEDAKAKVRRKKKETQEGGTKDEPKAKKTRGRKPVSKQS